MGNRPKLKGLKHKHFFKDEVVELPQDEKLVVKEVPAKVQGEVVGKTLIFEDGTCSIILDENMSEESKNILRELILEGWLPGSGSTITGDLGMDTDGIS